MNLSRVHNLPPEARNRVTTVYMVTFFLGGAFGSALAAYAWQRWQWPGVCGVGLLLPLTAFGSMKISS
jgi:predicted MFS family arabinose efflux permease